MEIEYEGILERMLSRVPDSMDKREGSIIMNALAPAAAELQMAYMEIDKIIGESYADTQSRDFLVRRAAERGISPKLASNAQRRAQFNVAVPLGSRFESGEFTFRVAEKLADGGYRLVAEEPGSGGNVVGLPLVPLDYISGLQEARFTHILSAGEDEEDTESLRRRYFYSIDSQAFGGNVADYREKALAMDGVGGVKVIPVWNGPGTVKVILLSSLYSTPSSSLVSSVQQAMDPSVGRGKGLGLAPIGHVCTVSGATGIIVSISTRLTLDAGVQREDVLSQLNDIADSYFEDLARQWADSQRLTVRISQLEARIMEIAGVVDVESTSINGSPKNLQLAPEQIPIRGQINATFA